MKIKKEFEIVKCDYCGNEDIDFTTDFYICQFCQKDICENCISKIKLDYDFMAFEPSFYKKNYLFLLCPECYKENVSWLKLLHQKFKEIVEICERKNEKSN